VNWGGLAGHENQKRGMESILRSGRLGQAYLLTGPDGVGKKRFARTVGGALLCLAHAKSPAEGPCGQCSSCRILQSAHPDLLETARPPDKQEFPIQVMKEFCEQFYLKPMISHRKVAIIDDADDLNQESANSFLKTLEEPPPGMVVFLIGNRLERQLPTILSRCQQISFGPLDAHLIETIADPELTRQPGWDLALAASEGSMRQALDLHQEALWKLVQRVGRWLNREVRAEPHLAKELQEWIEEAGKEGVEQRPRALAFFKALSWVFTRAWDPSFLSSPLVGRFPFLTRLGAAEHRSHLLRILDTLGRAGEMVERRVPLSLVTSWLVEEWHQVCERGPG